MHIGLKKIRIREDQKYDAHDRCHPEKKPLAFDHSQINKKEPEPVKGMEDE